MRQPLLPLCAAIVLATPAHAESEVSSAAVRLLRVEGAAVDVRRAAEDVEETFKIIHNSGSLSRLSTLKTRLEALHRMTVSARMALDVAVDEMGSASSE